MTHQEATVVLPLPMKIVENRLSDIERWDRFLVGVQKVERRSHERYMFRLDTGQEVLAVVRAHPHEHRFAWHVLGGQCFDGTVRLTALDGLRTRVRLSVTRRGAGVLADFMDMVAPARWRPTFEVQRLASLVGELPRGRGSTGRTEFPRRHRSPAPDRG